MVDDESSERAREQANKHFELSMDNMELMKGYQARAKSLAFNVKYHGVEVAEQEISSRILSVLPSAYDPEIRNIELKTDFS